MKVTLHGTVTLFGQQRDPDQGYIGTACRLQEFVLSLYDSNRYSFRLENHLGGFDTRHRAIYDQLLNWYREHGDDELTFVVVCAAILAQREAEARLDVVESMR